APPPAGDRWGPGSRIPTVIISPFARKGFVDHTTYDTTSILAFISKRFGLDLLPGIRTQFGDLRNAFEFAEE
ncbi:MAG: alkaline phosphatase family protein, partial [Bauldia litoralis]